MIVPLDVRYGFRKLNNSMGFTVVATVCLALGTCASITLFSVFDSAWPAGVRRVAEPLLLLAVVTALFMLAVCAGLEGSLLVRMAARREEIGVRLALGVTRGRLVRRRGLALILTGLGLGLASPPGGARRQLAVSLPGNPRRPDRDHSPRIASSRVRYVLIVPAIAPPAAIS